MTDKTERDALIRKLALHVRPTCSELYDEAMQALAAPAEGGQGEVVDLGDVIRDKVREYGSYRAASKAIGVNYPYLCQMAHDPNRKPSQEILAALGLERVTVTRRLIDSAGGAKCGVPVGYTTDADGSIVPGSAYDDDERNTPQLAGGDGAVACPRCGAPCTTTEEGCVDPMIGDTRHTAYHYTRPSATAAVPDAEAVLTEYCRICIEEHHEDTPRESRIEAMKRALAAAPAAPKGGVVDGFDAWFDEYSKQNYTDDMLARAAWNAALANQEQRHDALADGEAASA